MKCISVLASVLITASALAQTPPPSTVKAPVRDVCITVDEARDMMPPRDRAAALRFLARSFELEGRHVVPTECSMPYRVSHIRLGNRVVVTLTGTEGNREATALGLDDLPALYSQMVRSLVTGRPMTAFNVVDRTNVTASQAAPLRARADSFVYLRLGHGSNLGGGRGGPAGGFGFRTELDSFGIDVSFLNTQSNSGGPSTSSLLKLEGLYFRNPEANSSAYAGGGLSYAGSSFGGRGLQGELTVGYELARATSLRVFVQADATLPFYKTTFERYASFTGFTVGTERRYAPLITLSVGLGWQRNR
jgi:hypothetical protein